jgi:hypothetical protein
MFLGVTVVILRTSHLIELLRSDTVLLGLRLNI